MIASRVLLITLLVSVFSCGIDKPDIYGEWEGRYRRNTDHQLRKVRIRFKDNQVFCYEAEENNIASYVIRRDSIIITFPGASTIIAKLNTRKNCMTGKGFNPREVNGDSSEFIAIRKTSSNISSSKTEQRFDVSGEWESRYRYWKDAQFLKKRLVFEGEEVFLYRESGVGTIASWMVKNDSIIISFPADVTIRGTINPEKTHITGKQFTPSDPDGEPGEFIAIKQKAIVWAFEN